MQLSMIIEGDSSSASTPPARVVEKKVVVIGGGWAGFTVADSLSTCLGGSDNTIKVELLDASPRGPGGLAGGWRTPKLQRPVEAGIHGFWREYRNTFAAIERIGLELDDVLTEYTPSILVSQSGRVALAPVLGEAASTSSSSPSSDAKRQEYTRSPFPLPRGLEDLTNPNSAILSRIKEQLPPPLDVALFSEFNATNPLSIADRISALGLLGVWADFEQESEESWERYDGISAENLFRSIAGLSPNLYQELVSPLLHVLPMTPGYDCSAAAALSCFHVFALQSKGAFDVRWCRGTISEKIFNPWATQLQSRGNVNIRGSAKVTAIEEIEGKYVVKIGGSESIECDAVVMAVGGTALKRLLPSSPPLAKLKMADGWKKFRGVTCVAVRLFFQPSETLTGLPRSIEKAMKDSPVVVCGPNVGNIPQLAETGFCIYDLQRLQDEFKTSNKSQQGTEPCVAVEVDFFRAEDIAKMEDNMEIAKLTLRTIAAALNVEPINPDMILDASVVRARDAVSHFCVGSASWSPDVKLEKGLYMCGDWIDRTGHASWSTEKAVVTGRQAAEALATELGMTTTAPAVIPASSDTAQLAALRQASKLFRNVAPTDVIPPAPWVLLRQLSGGRI
jgi:uncharacterized protein with NAD-binding domain and iron-sulfur cluster